MSSPHSVASQKLRHQIEVRLRQKLEDKFFEEGDYGVRNALDGLHETVLESSHPKLALGAALWLFLIWTKSPKEPQFQEPLSQFLKSLYEQQQQHPLTIAFINGIEFIALTGMPVVDVDKLFMLPKVA